MRSDIAIASLLLDYINETSHTNHPGPSHMLFTTQMIIRFDYVLLIDFHCVYSRICHQTINNIMKYALAGVHILYNCEYNVIK